MKDITEKKRYLLYTKQKQFLVLSPMVFKLLTCSSCTTEFFQKWSWGWAGPHSAEGSSQELEGSKSDWANCREGMVVLPGSATRLPAAAGILQLEGGHWGQGATEDERRSREQERPGCWTHPCKCHFQPAPRNAFPGLSRQELGPISSPSRTSNTQKLPIQLERMSRENEEGTATCHLSCHSIEHDHDQTPLMGMNCFLHKLAFPPNSAPFQSGP